MGLNGSIKLATSITCPIVLITRLHKTNYEHKAPCDRNIHGYMKPATNIRYAAVWKTNAPQE